MSYRSNRTRLAVLLVCLAALVSPAIRAEEPAEIDPELRAKVVEVLEVSGSEKMALQAMDAMMAQIRATMPQVPEEWWTRFRAKAETVEYREDLVAIYARHFTADELDALLKFYRSPEGQSVLAKMPQVMQESFAVGAEWGRRTAAELLEELRAEGYDVD